MNERIQDLVEQAGITTNLDTDHYGKDAGKWVDYFAEKFAELIIREYSYDCMDVTSNSEHIQFVAKKWGVDL